MGMDAAEAEDAPDLVDARDVPVLDVPTMTDVPALPDAPEDAPRDVPPDTACEMRADCDMNGSCEVALGTVTNCQDCGDRCTAPAGATASCDFATGCGWTCNAGFENCDLADGNGCEVNTNTSMSNCGGCGLVCGTTLAGARAACSVGDCIVSCQTGFADCNGDLMAGSGSNGCEIDTRVSLMHCGGCGMLCELPPGAANATPVCMGSACRFTCTMGYRDCDGDLSNGCEHPGTTCG